MTASLSNLQAALQDALDDLTSPRTPAGTKLAALRALEHTLARATCVTGEDALLDHFLALQHTFQCNLPSRILGWMAGAIPRLEALPAAEDDAADVAAQLAPALSIIQGVALLHAPSKAWLGRSYALDLLIDLFLASRHLPSPSPTSTPTPSSTSPSTPTPSSTPTLASTTLDTLLCILVDSPPALRSFEARRGLHAVVRILKRAGTPRGVRMKCLEFLYFYLLDETPGPDTPAPTSTTTPLPPPPTPSTKHNTPPPPTPQKQMQNHKTPKPRALMMLRREIEYVPLSPAKPALQGVRAGARVGSGEGGIEYVPLSPEKPALKGVRAGSGSGSGGEGEGKRKDGVEGDGEGDVRKTTEEKKMLLGTMLGNVDALVEGVRRAGVWGLR